MCKLVIIPHIPEGKSKNAWRLAKAVTPAMTRGDNDGFGYAAVSSVKNEEGQPLMLAEKWLYPKDAWSNKLPGEFRGLEAALQGGLNKEVYRHFGVDLSDGSQRPSIQAIMLHSRYSTCGGGVENSHPFVLEDIDSPYAALVHNGVVNKEGLTFKQSSCDSEGILNKLEEERVFAEPGNLQKALDGIHGYYAYGMLALTLEDGWVMDVVKDSTAQLSACYVHELGAVVYATAADQVVSACKKLKWKRPTVARLRDNVRIRYHVETGETLVIDGFKSASYVRQGWHNAHASGNYSQAMSLEETNAHWDDMEEAYYKQKQKGSADAATKSGGLSSGAVKFIDNPTPSQKAWACLDCGETFFSEYGAASCDHGLGKDGAAALLGGGKKNCALTDEQSAVQEALAAMDGRDDRDSMACGVIDPNTGAITLSDGSIIELADESLVEVDEIEANSTEKVMV